MFQASLVYAIEWNPDALAALAYNLRQNKVEERCIVIPGNNEEVRTGKASINFPVSNCRSFLIPSICGLTPADYML